MKNLFSQNENIHNYLNTLKAYTKHNKEREKETVKSKT